MSERTPPPVPDFPTLQRPPRKSLTNWTLIPPLALLCGGILQAARTPEPEASGPAREVTTTQRQRKGPAAAEQSSQPPAAYQDTFTVFYPDTQGRLVQKFESFRHNEIDTNGIAQVKANLALKRLESEVPRWFPAGSFVTAVWPKGDAVVLDFSPQWYSMPLWRKNPGAARLAQQAIIATVAAAREGDSTRDLKVRFTSDGKPARTLGSLDVSEPQIVKAGG